MILIGEKNLGCHNSDLTTMHLEKICPVGDFVPYVTHAYIYLKTFRCDLINTLEWVPVFHVVYPRPN